MIHDVVKKQIEFSEKNLLKMELLRETASASVLYLLDSLYYNLHMTVEEARFLIDTEYKSIDTMNTEMELEIHMPTIRANMEDYFYIYLKKKTSPEILSIPLSDADLKMCLNTLKTLRLKTTHLIIPKPFTLSNDNKTISLDGTEISFSVRYPDAGLVAEPEKIIFNYVKKICIASFFYKRTT